MKFNHRIITRDIIKFFKNIFLMPFLKIGNIDQMLGENESALENFSSALGIYKSVLGEESPGVAKVLNSLGVIYGKSCEYNFGCAAIATLPFQSHFFLTHVFILHRLF